MIFTFSSNSTTSITCGSANASTQTYLDNLCLRGLILYQQTPERYPRMTSDQRLRFHSIQDLTVHKTSKVGQVILGPRGKG